MRPILLGFALLGLMFSLGSCARKAQQGVAMVPDSPQSAAPSASQSAAPATGAETSASPASPTETGSTPSRAAGTGWPGFLGPNHNGISPETGLNKDWSSKPPTPRWTVSLSDGGYAGPAVADGVVYLIDHQGKQDRLRALDITNGAERWATAYDEPLGDNNGYARCTPAISGGRVYVLTRSGVVHCLRTDGGAIVWSRDLVRDFGGRKPKWDYSMSPLVDGNRVIVCPGGTNAAVVALDAATGKTLWQGGGSDAPGYATPVAATLGGKKQYVVFTAAGVCGVAATGGDRLWFVPWQTNYDVNAATPIVVDDAVFITSGYNRGCGLADPLTGRVRWENREMQSQFSTPVLADGYIYGTTDPGDLVCLDPKTGTVRWRQRGFEKGGVAAADGVLFAVNGSAGDVVMVRLTPDSYQELGRVKPLTGQHWTAPIIANGCLLVRNKSTLACLPLK